MADPAAIPSLERLSYFPGQSLLARDLTERLRREQELRWLHTRCFHSWGIGIGFGVVGEQGASAVGIDSGFGCDCLGREVLLQSARTLPIPAVAGTADGQPAVYYLTAAYQEDADQPLAERRAGVCVPDGTVRLGEEPLLAWRKEDALQEGHELVLARVKVKNCKLAEAVDLSVRRRARPPQQPYIAAGQTSATATAWQPWVIQGKLVGLFTDVDTSGAQFQTTPRYTVQLVGDRAIESAVAGVSLQLPVLILPFTTVDAVTPASFRLSALLLLTDKNDVTSTVQNFDQATLAALANTLGWHAAWLGIEGGTSA